MDLSIDLSTLAKVVKGELVKGKPEAPFNAFVTDTRELKSGGFFWAPKGASYDAYVFLPQAILCAGTAAQPKPKPRSKAERRDQATLFEVPSYEGGTL